MAYTTIDDPSAYFQTTLYTGNGGTQSITNTGNSDLQPDWIWIKARNEAEHHNLVDSVRGNTKVVYSSMSNSEDTTSIQVTSFASDGFALGSGTNTNKNNITYAAWQWKAGTSFTNDASSTGIGSIDSAGSFNNDAGFSIVTYTGNGSSGATVKHGMNQKPAMFIIKDRDNSNEGWMVYHKFWGATKYQRLNETGAVATGSAYFNNTEPTSSVFTIGNNDVVNKSGDKYVTYCFAEKQGYSKFGSYAANENVNGPFVYTGFKPAFVILRQSNLGRDWHMFDNKRSTFNAVGRYLRPNVSGAEDSGEDYLDLLSNGFKLKNTGNRFNDADGTYIFMAFAESPFVTSTGIPTTAR